MKTSAALVSVLLGLASTAAGVDYRQYAGRDWIADALIEDDAGKARNEPFWTFGPEVRAYLEGELGERIANNKLVRYRQPRRREVYISR
ncbi:hypothetical protein CDD83_3875 [Cordyceps sp. RAO-2017]|nr:hypothetical protein CDD83_3875 [Cordyceps sp. RAO-2017]